MVWVENNSMKFLSTQHHLEFWEEAAFVKTSHEHFCASCEGWLYFECRLSFKPMLI